jgi:hypothetical protein
LSGVGSAGRFPRSLSDGLALEILEVNTVPNPTTKAIPVFPRMVRRVCPKSGTLIDLPIRREDFFASFMIHALSFVWRVAWVSSLRLNPGCQRTKNPSEYEGPHVVGLLLRRAALFLEEPNWFNQAGCSTLVDETRLPGDQRANNPHAAREAFVFTNAFAGAEKYYARRAKSKTISGFLGDQSSSVQTAASNVHQTRATLLSVTAPILKTA